MIVVLPAEIAFTVPPETVATFSLLEVHVIVSYPLVIFPTGLKVAVNIDVGFASSSVISRLIDFEESVIPVGRTVPLFNIVTVQLFETVFPLYVALTVTVTSTLPSDLLFPVRVGLLDVEDDKVPPPGIF